MKNLPRLTLVCLLFLPIPAIAQEQGTADERQACEPDVNRLCSQFIPDRDKIILCLNQKVRELSPSCRASSCFTRSSKSAQVTAAASVVRPGRTGKRCSPA
jgi:hypothetical protein